jgi:Tfp pilus assembly pilus retraction ATPase PilT
MRICSFSKENMYTNIPRIEATDIITNTLKINSGINENSQKEIMHILKTIMEQNYFQFEQKYYKQTDGLAMGAPTSAVIAETYIQNMEHKQI